MNEYYVVHFESSQEQNDILIALLADLAFDSFEEIEEDGLKAYIAVQYFDEETIGYLLETIPLLKGLKYKRTELEKKNWNEEWEKNFKPIIIGERCLVRAPFHKSKKLPYDLIIEPKMAFGTGHHATTSMMIELMLDIDFNEKTVLDFGSGTGILSILASKMGASKIIANDIEKAAYINIQENIDLNNSKNVFPLHGDITVLPKTMYDVILANVTTNIIKQNFSKLEALLNEDAQILFSGILHNQCKEIEHLAQNLKFIQKVETDNWMALHYKK